MTLRRGYSPTGSRFSAAGIPATPRRLCPSQRMLLAAFSSRSATYPHFGQLWVRTESALAMRSPQSVPSARTLEQSWVVYAAGTASTRLPAHAALYARTDRKWRHPASCMLLLLMSALMAKLGPPTFVHVTWVGTPDV